MTSLHIDVIRVVISLDVLPFLVQFHTQIFHLMSHSTKHKIKTVTHTRYNSLTVEFGTSNLIQHIAQYLVFTTHQLEFNKE